MSDVDAETQVDEIMNKLDADGSGSIDYSGTLIYLYLQSLFMQLLIEKNYQLQRDCFKHLKLQTKIRVELLQKMKLNRHLVKTLELVRKFGNR